MVSLLKRWIRYSVVRKGGSSPLWTAIGVLGVLNSLRKKYAGRQITSILNDGIRPGEVIEIRHTGNPSKDVRKERAKKAAMLAQLVAADEPGSQQDRGRTQRRAQRKAKATRKRFAGTVINEMARDLGRGRSGSTTAPVVDLLPAATNAIRSTDRPLTGRQLRRATKAARKATRTATRTATKATR